MKQKHLNIPVSPETHRAVKAAAAQRGVTVQKLVQTTLAASFAFQRPAEPPQQRQREAQP